MNEILYGRNCGMEMMETCESSLKSGTMEQFPFKYPKIFISILLHCGTRDIHTIRSSFKSQKVLGVGQVQCMFSLFQVRVFQLASMGHSFYHTLEKDASTGSSTYLKPMGQFRLTDVCLLSCKIHLKIKRKHKVYNIKFIKLTIKFIT